MKHFSQFFLLSAAEFTSLRGYLMIAAMKLISLAFDFDNGKHGDASLGSIFAYVFNPATIYFGPWVEFGRYKALADRQDTFMVDPFMAGRKQTRAN